MKDLYAPGTVPPVGVVPARMYAQTIRADRFGAPRDAFAPEIIDVPTPRRGEVLVLVMAAGINFNNVWAALGSPLDVIALRQRQGAPEPFHVGGSDASGIVYATGPGTAGVEVGDEVVVHCGSWDPGCPEIAQGLDPTLSPSFRIWGYETNYGSFAQFALVKGHQCLPKPARLSWEAAAAYMLTGATAYRMLHGHESARLRAGDVVLVWGAAGGLGSMAIQVARAAGALPVAVVSSDAKADHCRKLGAIGVVDRRRFDHWGSMPSWRDAEAHGQWLAGARRFGRAIWDAVGARRNPRIVVEHPGEETLPTSMFVCDAGGMVVTCAGTTGYNGVVDLRHLWMRQKRLQGSHFANDAECRALNDLVAGGLIDPCVGRTFPFDGIAEAHQLMYENRLEPGNATALVGARRPGLCRTAESLAA